jgi:post-segregation antitoxin (ccd killing protein)
MSGRWRAGRLSPVPQANAVVPAAAAALAQQYDITINGTYQRTINSDLAETTFRRWSESPDVRVRGDLRTGFFWEWPYPTRTRIEFVPKGDTGSNTDSPAVPADAAAPFSVPGAVTA